MNSKDDAALLNIFGQYFAPNSQFYSDPDSLEFKAYFGAINAAIPEMLNAPVIFEKATQRTQGELLRMLDHKIPGLTNSLICALIFCVGQFAVIQDAVYCVDFSEKIPNCIALYLLLTAQKKPAESRKQLIDAGEGTNTVILEKAVESLKVCDPNWHCIIM